MSYLKLVGKLVPHWNYILKSRVNKTHVFKVFWSSSDSRKKSRFWLLYFSRKYVDIFTEWLKIFRTCVLYFQKVMTVNKIHSYDDVSPCLSHTGESRSGHGTPGVASPRWAEEKGNLLQLAGNSPLNPAQDKTDYKISSKIKNFPKGFIQIYTKIFSSIIIFIFYLRKKFWQKYFQVKFVHYL